MKIRLPKAMLAAVLSAMLVSGVQAATMYPSEVLELGAGETTTWHNFDNLQGGDADSPFVKDGEGTLRFENVQGSTTNYYKAPIVAREGKVEFVDSTIYAHGAYTPSKHANTWLMVGGQDAEMTFTNSSFNIATGETHMNVGTADGSGTLTLDNTNMKITGSIFSGYHSYAGNEDSWGLGWYYNYNGTAATDDIPAENQNPKSIEHRYTEGSYTDGYNGQNRKFGEGTINVTNGSKLDVATAFTMGTSTLNVKGAGSSVVSQTGYGGIVADGSEYEDTYAIILGRWSGAKSTINVTDGAQIESNGQLRTQRSSGLANTYNEINVDGEGSKFHVKATANLGLYEGTNNTTVLNVTKGGEAAFAKTVMGASGVDVNIDSTSTFSSDLIEVKNGSLDNDGTITAYTEDSEEAMLKLIGGSVVNNGTIEIDTMIDSGALTLNGGLMADITMNGGELNVEGYSKTESLTLNGGKVWFSEGAVLDLQGNELVLNGADLMLMIADDAPLSEKYTLFTNASKDVEFNITLVDAQGKNLGSATGVASIPEPTTATLSLLALAGLVARRRRK
ncbi:MAG: PEP-CTERM sorting domain-containing protein [Akkermansia sp.]|nr:PEP-CTERM sorting domain-containing protein [Akkermansia sp.]